MWWRVTFNRSRKVGAGKHCNICWALGADVTFLSSVAFQIDSQAVTNPGGTRRLHLLTFIFTGALSSSVRSLYSTIWARPRIRYLWSLGRKNQFYWKKLFRRKKECKKLRKLTFPPLPTPLLWIYISNPQTVVVVVFPLGLSYPL